MQLDSEVQRTWMLPKANGEGDTPLVTGEDFCAETWNCMHISHPSDLQRLRQPSAYIWAIRLLLNSLYRTIIIYNRQNRLVESPIRSTNSWKWPNYNQEQFQPTHKKTPASKAWKTAPEHNIFKPQQITPHRCTYQCLPNGCTSAVPWSKMSDRFCEESCQTVHLHTQDHWRLLLVICLKQDLAWVCLLKRSLYAPGVGCLHYTHNI